MKPNIHPDYHTITLVMTDGSKLQTRSTYGKEGDKIQLDVDPSTHPAWTKGAGVVNTNINSIAKFNSKFGNLGFGGAAASKKEDKKEDKKDNK